MALSPQQLQALFQSIDAGQQSAFSGATPGMNQDERNQWINSYGPGGTNYGDFINWYGGQHGANGHPSSNPPPLMASLPNPTGTSYTQGSNFSGGGGAGSFSAGVSGGPSMDMRVAPPASSEVRTGAAGTPSGVWDRGTGWQQSYSPGYGTTRGANNPYAAAPSNPNVPPTTGGITPPPYGNPVGGGGGIGAKPRGYSFAAGGWAQPSPWGKTQWH